MKKVSSIAKLVLKKKTIVPLTIDEKMLLWAGDAIAPTKLKSAFNGDSCGGEKTVESKARC